MRRNGFRAATAGLTGITYLSFAVVLAGGGCVSNEYRISRDELLRLARTPLESRGRGVHVLQDVGSRRDGERETPTEEQLRRAWEPVYDDGALAGDDGADTGPGDVRLDVAVGGSGPRHHVQPRGLDGHFAGGARPVANTLRGRAGDGGGHVGGGDLFPTGGGSHGGGGGGGGDGAGAALAVVAVVAVAIAAGIAIGLVASEGIRFQGEVEMAPEQLLYVDHVDASTTAVPLGSLGPADVADATGAVVKDDEGYGLILGRRDPLDRRGGMFGLELGATAFNLGSARGVGPAAEIQIGGFFLPRWGLVMDVGVSGGDVAIGGAASAVAATSVVTRHHVALELQAFPATLGPFHFGLFGRAGGALVGTSEGVQGGLLAGGGAMVQLELTSRLALVLRGGVDTADLGGVWSTAGTATGGIAIY